MTWKQKRPLLSFFCLLLALSLCLSSCGFERIAKPGNGETGEFYQSSDKHFDAFCQTVFLEEMSDASTLDLHYTVKNPKQYGLSEKEVSLGSYDLASMIQASKQMKSLKNRLLSFDRDSLSKDRRILYDTLLEALDSSLLFEGLELYEQPLSPTIGIQAQLPVLLAEYAFYSVQDVEDYLTLLSQIDEYYSQLLTFEEQKADAGLGPSDASIDAIIASCQSYLTDPETHFLTETFEERLEELEKAGLLSSGQKTVFKERHLSILREHFLPAYEHVISGMGALKGRGIQDEGLCHFKDGKRYYEALVRSGPGLSFTVKELQSVLKKQMQEDLSQISLLYQKNPSLSIPGTAFRQAEPAQLLEDLKKQMAEEFPPISNSSYEVCFVPQALEDTLSPAFYLTAPIDDPGRNVIYINRKYSGQANDLYPTLAHEGFPGHLYQTVYNREQENSPLAALLSCSGACEGWATYAELLSCEFDNGLPKDAAKYRALLRSFSLSAHGLLDIGIHYDGWSKEQAKEFIQSWFQADEETVNALWQAILDNPANYLEYCGGYAEIRQMRREAEAALGEHFSPLEFHTFLLDMGPVPFAVTRSYFSQWLSEKVSDFSINGL